MTLANRVTVLRLALSIVYFAVLAVGREEPEGMLPTIAFVLFLVVSVSDILDGYLARRYGEVTHFGRILDPLVDKIIVCGSFAFFLTIDPLTEIFSAWFLVVVMAREFLVSGLRGVLEASGIAFGAMSSGKIKTFVQNVAVGTGLGYAAWFQDRVWTAMLTEGLMWGTLAVTVVSGLTYLAATRRLLREHRKERLDG